MRITSQGNVQKNITISPNLFYSLLFKAKEAALSFQDYIRVLLSASVREDVPLVDEQTETRLAQAADDLKNGRYTRISSTKELDKYLKNV